MIDASQTDSEIVDEFPLLRALGVKRCLLYNCGRRPGNGRPYISGGMQDKIQHNCESCSSISISDFLLYPRIAGEKLLFSKIILILWLQLKLSFSRASMGTSLFSAVIPGSSVKSCLKFLMARSPSRFQGISQEIP